MRSAIDQLQDQVQDGFVAQKTDLEERNKELESELEMRHLELDTLQKEAMEAKTEFHRKFHQLETERALLAQKTQLLQAQVDAVGYAQGTTNVKPPLWMSLPGPEWMSGDFGRQQELIPGVHADLLREVNDRLTSFSLDSDAKGPGRYHYD